MHNLHNLLGGAGGQKQLTVFLGATLTFPEHLGSSSAKGRHVAAFSADRQEAWCSRLPAACPLRHAGHAVLRPRWPRTGTGTDTGTGTGMGTGTGQPGRAAALGSEQRHLGSYRAPQQRSGPEHFVQDVGKPGHGKSLFLSDSDLFARCNKAQVQGNSSGLQYVKFCSLCQDRCWQFQEMIPNLLTEEQNVLPGDFMVIKLMAVANFKKHYHLNA